MKPAEKVLFLYRVKHPVHGEIEVEAVDRLRREGYKNCFVFVLRENEKARKFYAGHGFAWDGTHADIPFPPDAVCVDLRYTKHLN